MGYAGDAMATLWALKIGARSAPSISQIGYPPKTRICAHRETIVSTA